MYGRAVGAGVGFVCSKKDCWLAFDDTPVVAEAAELVKTASADEDECEESERAARSGSVYIQTVGELCLVHEMVKSEQ